MASLWELGDTSPIQDLRRHESTPLKFFFRKSKTFFWDPSARAWAPGYRMIKRKFGGEGSGAGKNIPDKKNHS